MSYTEAVDHVLANVCFSCWSECYGAWCFGAGGVCSRARVSGADGPLTRVGIKAISSQDASAAVLMRGTR